MASGKMGDLMAGVDMGFGHNASGSKQTIWVNLARSRTKGVFQVDFSATVVTSESVHQAMVPLVPEPAND